MLRWFSIRSGGASWPITLVDRAATTVLDGARRGYRFVGMTFVHTHSIYVDAALPREAQEAVALHEICHAVLDDANLPLWIEERVVNALSPRLLPVLKANGFRFPPRPLGAAALERRARKRLAPMQSSNIWSDSQLDAAMEALRRVSTPAEALPTIAAAVGHPVTTDSLRNVFGRRGLGAPSSHCGKVEAEAAGPAEAKVEPRTAPTRDFSGLFAAAKKGIDFLDLCDELGLPPKATKALVEEARASGMHIDTDAGGRVAYRPREPSTRVTDIVPPTVGKRQRVAVISDTHLGSKYCLREQLKDFVHYAYESGIKEVLHPGDATDGMYRHGRWELSHHGIDEQAQDLFETLPQLPGLTYTAITGNHDSTFTDECGIDTGHYLEAFFKARQRNDLRFVGNRGAFVRIRGALVHLWHPRSGGAYADSYPVQRQVEKYAPGEKPQILLCGHWHRFVHIYKRGVHAIACPTFQGGGSAFGKSLGGAPAIGGLVLGWNLTETGTMRDFSLEYRAYFEHEEEHKVQHHDVQA